MWTTLGSWVPIWCHWSLWRILGCFSSVWEIQQEMVDPRVLSLQAKFSSDLFGDWNMVLGVLSDNPWPSVYSFCSKSVSELPEGLTWTRSRSLLLSSCFTVGSPPVLWYKIMWPPLRGCQGTTLRSHCKSLYFFLMSRAVKIQTFINYQFFNIITKIGILKSFLKHLKRGNFSGASMYQEFI